MSTEQDEPNPSNALFEIKPEKTSSQFTLFQLLALIVILAIPMGLFFSFMRVAREMQHQESCLNNSRSIALATLNYESAHRKFPKGYNGPLDYDQTWAAHCVSPSGYQFGGPLVAISPFLDKPHNSFYFEDYRIADAYWTSNDINQFAASKPHEQFICPADNADARRLIGGTDKSSTFILLSGRGNGLWINDVLPDPVASHHAVTNYLGCAGDFLPSPDQPAVWGDYRGVFEFGHQITIDQISDGTSNTLIYGEATGRGTNTCFAWTCSSQVTHWNGESFAGVRYPDYNGAWWCFGSNHRGQTSTWTFADGASRLIAESINPKVLRQLSGRADGNRLPMDDAFVH